VHYIIFIIAISFPDLYGTDSWYLFYES